MASTRRARASKAAAIAVAVAALVGACTDQVLMHDPPESSTSSTSASTSTSTGVGGAHVSSVTVGRGGAASSSTGAGAAVSSSGVGAGGAGGGFGCLAGGEVFVMNVAAFDGSVLGCDATTVTAGDTIVEGKVVDSAPGSFKVDSCVSSCDPQITTITYSAPGLTPDIPKDDLVRVVAHVELGWFCSQQLLVIDLPTYGTLQNPFGSDGQLRLAAADGTTDVSVEAPFAIDPVSQGCDSGNVFPFSLRFFSPENPEDAVEVAQEQVAMWPASVAPPGGFTVTNLRSYRTTDTMADSNWGYWVAPLSQPSP